MRYIESPSTDPRFNLALEQYVFDQLPRSETYFMLWQNDNAIIVGKYQNTVAEINAAFVQEQGIRVVRRLSGGGAVYHDLGNLNFTFITDESPDKTIAFDFSRFCAPVVSALAHMGVQAEISGRNDMTIDGKKFSGNSQYARNHRIMHHGTLLYDADLEKISHALQVTPDKIVSKGVKSVRARVTNIKEYMPSPLPLSDFRRLLKEAMLAQFSMTEYLLTPADFAAVRLLQAERYDTWAWNYGFSPAYDIRKERRIEGCGKLEVCMNVAHGCITGMEVFGDYFANREQGELLALLRGCPLERSALLQRLAEVPVGDFFGNLTADEFADILLL